MEKNFLLRVRSAFYTSGETAFILDAASIYLVGQQAEAVRRDRTCVRQRRVDQDPCRTAGDGVARRMG